MPGAGPAEPTEPSDGESKPGRAATPAEPGHSPVPGTAETHAATPDGDADAALRADIRRLGDLLGQTLARQ
ncbi:MAG: hypothetical protein ACRDT8_16090, partial [Micromonosporaceae bacterium]